MTFELAGRLDTCVLLSYAVDAGQALSLLPPPLEPLTYRGAAFLNIVVCHVDRMRPRFAPDRIGVSGWHVAYRLQVRARLAGGTVVEGLYFLRSQVDMPVLGAIGNRLTDFKFHRAAVRFRSEGDGWRLRVSDPSGHASATLRLSPPAAGGSLQDCLFRSAGERERLLRYTPLGLSVARSGRRLRLAEVIRDETSWREEPVTVESSDWSYPRSVGLDPLRPVCAVRVAPIDYRWRIGRVENLSPDRIDGASPLEA